MQIHVVDSSFGFVKGRFVTIFVLHKKMPSTSRVWFFRILTLGCKNIKRHPAVFPISVMDDLHMELFSHRILGGVGSAAKCSEYLIFNSFSA